eukprot:TRINITY_DN1091_c0_g3_i1.p1 TRINITY_DN1091_c0_g3~~TRINITY_DN1091_c0_g3_i1.p1  ORF type:complete len:1102 (+),score=169.81 TRINITY_DN1091_c0_g3_i1:69-3374(+)
MAREKAAYLARLAARAGRFDEMARHLVEMSRSPDELSAEDGYLMSIAYNHAVSTRRTALRRLATDAKRETDGGGEGCNASFASEYSAKVKKELHRILEAARKWLGKNLESHAMTDEARVFYHKMKADNCRDIAEHCSAADEPDSVAIHSAQQAYKNALAHAESVLPATHPIRHCLALNHAVFQNAVVNNPESACMTAPAITPCGLENCNSVPALLVSCRLSSLLLEFPDAAIAGVPWSTLTLAYFHTYNEHFDIVNLGYTSPCAAVESLLLGVCGSSWNRGINDGKFTDPVIALADEVALTPLPGYLATWPSLYKTLCAMLQHFGADGVPPIDGSIDRPGKSLVLSKVRPLLEKLEEGESNAIVSQPLRSWLLSQLKPISHAKQAKQLIGQGMTFRNADGKSRKLDKIGHLVQAVLRWRHQRLLHCSGDVLRSTAIDKVLEPNLELAFSKRCNNLVLFSTHGTGCAEKCPEYYRDFHSEIKAAMQPSENENQECSAAVQAPICIRRSCSTPPLHCLLQKPSLAKGENLEALRIELLVSGSVAKEQQRISSGVAADFAGMGLDPPAASEKTRTVKDDEVRVTSWSSEDRSRSRCRFREVSREGRARSLTREQVAHLHSSGASKRSTSEPPHFRDDPFEPPLQEFWASAKDPKPAAPMHPDSSSPFANLPMTVLVAMPMPEVLPPKVPPGLDPVTAAETPHFSVVSHRPCMVHDGFQMPTCSSHDRGRSQCRFGAVSHESRARSLTREQPLGSHSSTAALRSTSEPPHFCDDPFEPPAQELWACAKASKPSPSFHPDLFSCFTNLPPNILVAMPLQQGMSSNAAPRSEPFHMHSRGRSQSRFTAISREGRARSLTKDHALDSCSSTTAKRSTSEPPHFCDDPFEPPPQELWASARDMRPANSASCFVNLPQATLAATPQATAPISSLCLAGVRMHSEGRTRVASQESRAKSLSTDLDVRESFGQLGTGAKRSNSEPPCAYDDPFEPPPQELWASAPTATSRTLNLETLLSHPTSSSVLAPEQLSFPAMGPVNLHAPTLHSTGAVQLSAAGVGLGMMPRSFLQSPVHTRPWSRARSWTRAGAMPGTTASCNAQSDYFCNRSMSR